MSLDTNTAVNYTDKTTIKNWFKTGLKPTQTQFWSQLDSFWHKSETLPITSIKGLGALIDGKAEINHNHSQYATNDATSLTPQNIAQWQKKLGVDDLDYVEIPTTSGTEQSHPYVVVIDTEGKSAKRNATEFGKVDTIDGVLADETKDVKLGAIRKYDNNIVSDDFSISSENESSSMSVESDGYTYFTGNVTHQMIGSEVIDIKNGFGLISNTDYSTIEPTNKLIYAQRIYVDAMQSKPSNWTSSQQRMSSLASKHNDATYNRLLGMDSNGNLNEVGIYALISEMLKANDSQKDNWRNAMRKSNETTGNTVPSITSVNAVTLGNNAGFNFPFSVVGVNLNLVQSVNLIKVKDDQGKLIPEESVPITNFTRDSATRISIEYPTNTFTNGFIVVEFVDSLYYSVRSEEIEVSDVIKPFTPPVVTWTYIGPENRITTNDIVAGNKITLLNNSIDNNQFTNRCNYDTNAFITRDMVMQGFEITFKTSYVFKDSKIRIDGYPPIGIYLKTPDGINFLSLIQDDINLMRYDIGSYKINSIQTTVFTGGNTENSIQNYLQQSYVNIKYKNGLMNLIIYYEDGTIKNYKRSIYVPPSSSIVSGGLKVGVDIGGAYTPYQNAILDRSIEIIDFKIK